MASTFTTLGIEKMATGENAGTWGDKTNTNLDIVNTAVSGYVEQAVTNGGTLALGITDGASTATAQNAVIKLTGTITGNSIVTVPDSVEKVYIITNGTSGAYTVQFKTASGTGVTFGVSEKTTKLLYSDGTNIVDAGFSGGTDLDGKELILDADGDTSITADTDDQIDIKIAGTDQLTIKDGALSPVTDNDIDLGTSTLEFKDAFFDGTVTSDAFAGPLTGDVTGNVSGSAATVTTAAQSNITSLGTLTTLTVDDITINGSTISDAGDFTLDVEGDIILDANGADIFLKDAGTTYGSLTNTSGNLIVKSGTTTALTFSGANVTVAGDLTVSGDDITMGTNTAGNLLVADGTNFNSIAVTALAEISTAASDDVFLAIDTSGGGLKKIARSAVVAGLATDSAISNVVDDTSPQLGGNLDMNGADIVTTSNATIDLAPNGTGTVVVRGNTNSGAIVFNCESNSHGQKVIAQPHSASVTNTMLLPAGANSTLVSLVSTDTLTNKTLTSPKINEDVAVTSTATELNLLDGVSGLVQADLTKLAAVDSTAAELNIIDGNTTIGTTAVADGDGIVTNDGGTMRQTTVQTFATYFGSEITAMSNLVTTGALNSGSITSGFGAIDNGTSNIRSATITAETAFVPDASGGADLGTTALEFNDAFFNDGAVINFGDDQDTTLTHTDGTGLTLNSTNKLCFNDASQFIQGASATVLDIAATDEIELTATLIDVVGNLAASGTLAQAGVATFAVAANVAQVAITSSSNAIAWDASAAANAYHITTENTTFSAPSNAVEGAFIAVEINYNGSHTIAFNTVFEFAASTAPTTTDTDGKTDILVFRYNGAVWQEVGRTLNLAES